MAFCNGKKGTSEGFGWWKMNKRCGAVFSAEFGRSVYRALAFTPLFLLILFAGRVLADRSYVNEGAYVTVCFLMVCAGVAMGISCAEYLFKGDSELFFLALPASRRRILISRIIVQLVFTFVFLFICYLAVYSLTARFTANVNPSLGSEAYVEMVIRFGVMAAITDYICGVCQVLYGFGIGLFFSIICSGRAIAAICSALYPVFTAVSAWITNGFMDGHLFYVRDPFVHRYLSPSEVASPMYSALTEVIAVGKRSLEAYNPLFAFHGVLLIAAAVTVLNYRSDGSVGRIFKVKRGYAFWLLPVAVTVAALVGDSIEISSYISLFARIALACALYIAAAFFLERGTGHVKRVLAVPVLYAALNCAYALVIWILPDAALSIAKALFYR